MLAPVMVLGTTQAASRPRAIYVAGVDVGLSVDPSSIDVTEAGPGGVSSMSFVIDDPGIAYVIADGMDISFMDQVNGLPIFSGWVQAWSYLPDFGNQGRRIAVTAQGVEALLDWLYFPGTISVTAFGQKSWELIASVYAQCVGPTNQLRVFTDTSLANSNSTQAAPTAMVHSSSFANQNYTIGPMTLREAIRLIYLNIAWTGLTAWATVDTYSGLRTSRANDTGRMPADWTSLTINDVPGGTIISEFLSHEVDAGGIIRGVYVTGGNAAGTGVVMDGTGKVGAVVPLTDTSILTNDDKVFAAFSYLTNFAIGNRGSFRLTDYVPVVTIHPGAFVNMTDARASQAAQNYMIGQIHKTFGPVYQSWEITYGGMAPSAMKVMRRLTRATLS
jgi:hypothetical protein